MATVDQVLVFGSYTSVSGTSAPRAVQPPVTYSLPPRNAATEPWRATAGPGMGDQVLATRS